MAATRLERLWKHFDAFAPLLVWAVPPSRGATRTRYEQRRAVHGRTPHDEYALYWHVRRLQIRDPSQLLNSAARLLTPYLPIFRLTSAGRAYCESPVRSNTPSPHHTTRESETVLPIGWHDARPPPRVALRISGVLAHRDSSGWSAPRWLVNADGRAAL